MIRKGTLTFAATAVLLITSIGGASADGGNKFEHGAQLQRIVGIQAQMGQQQSTFTAISNALNVKN